MKNKTQQISFGIQKIQELLIYLNPEKKWDIIYSICDPSMFDEWQVQYHGLLAGEEYIFILDGGQLLYAINVTGDSVLCAISELMNLLVSKF